MEIAIFQHEKSENAGLFNQFFMDLQVPFRNVNIYEINEVPPVNTSHLLLMGGPMSVHDEEEYPFLQEEKEIIWKYIKVKRPVLGICLGAQLIASVLGGRVYQSEKEIGWSRVHGIKTSLASLFPDHFFVFQMHGETFEVPPGGKLICIGEVVKNQAFSFGSAMGIQFHVEMTLPMIEAWVQDFPANERNRILSDTLHYIETSKTLCHRICDNFLNQG